MFSCNPGSVGEAVLDWHEVGALRVFTTFSDQGAAGVVELFAALAAERDALTAQMWEAAAFLLDRAPAAGREFVGDELAGAMNVHPATGQAFATTASTVMQTPALVEAVQRGELGERHVLAALDALTLDLPVEVRDDVARSVVERFRVRAAARGVGWPTPGELRQALRKELLQRDVIHAVEREEKATERRGVHLSPLPDGQALLSLEGPAVQVLAMHDAIQAAAGVGRGPGDTRSSDARAFDAGLRLLTAASLEGEGRLRGIEVQVLLPFSTATGGDLELAELVGYGPILPSTARELMAQADSVRRVCLDARTGAVLTVDDAVRIDDADREQAIRRAVEAMATDPVLVRDLSTHAYRPTMRLIRQVRMRDRTCVFPGCTRTARFTDLDHRDPWPRGRTHPDNLHCLCRRHHRAKQAAFTVTREPDGITVWTSLLTGKTYRRPPPDWT